MATVRADLSRVRDDGFWFQDAEFVILGNKEITVIREIAMPEWIRKHGADERNFAIHVVHTASLTPVVLRFSAVNGQQRATVMSVDEDGEMTEPYKTVHFTHIVIPF